MADPTSVTQQIVSESPAVEAYKLSLLKNASNLAYNVDANGNPTTTLASQLPNYQIAGFAPGQTAALNAANATGIGAFAPYVNAAQKDIGAGAATTQNAIDTLQGADTRNQFGAAQTAMGNAGQAASNISGGVGGINTGMASLNQANALANQSARADLNPANAAIQGGIGGLGQAAGTVQGAVGKIASGQGQYDPNSAAAYMNPYTQQVLQAQLGEMNRQSQLQQQANTSQATKAGAFGGDRAAVQQAETQRNNAQLQNQAIAQSYNQNYTQAQQAAMQAYEQGQQRNLAAGQATAQAGQVLSGIAGQQGQLGQGLGTLAINNAQVGQGAANVLNQGAATAGNLAGQQGNIYAQQASADQALGQGIGSLAAQQYGIGQNMASTMGTLGGQQSNIGVQQAALGQTAQQMNQNDINMLYNAGDVEQNLTQAQLDAQRSNTLQQVYAPYQQAGFLSDIYKGAPSTSMATTGVSAATPSPFIQGVGAVGSALTGAAGARKAGLI